MSNDRQHTYNEQGRCMWCDCRAWGAWAKEPCGATELSGPPMTAEQFTAGWRLYAEAMEIAGADEANAG